MSKNQSQYVFDVTSARSNGSVRRLKSFGTRSDDERLEPDLERALDALLHEHDLPVVEPEREDVAVVGEVDEALARDSFSLPVRYGSRL